MVSIEQEKFYKAVLAVIGDHSDAGKLDDRDVREEVATILSRQLFAGDLDVYKRLIRIFETDCTAYSLADELDRVRIARAIAKDW